MNIRYLFGIAAIVAGCATPPEKPEPAAKIVEETITTELPEVEIPYTKFVLPNGLTLVVHEDRKAPLVAVNVWYHVGSKNETPGRTGFAHLFEHLMFQGSENYQGEYFEPLEKIGATDLNGTTNRDRTNYFQTVPKHALDVALFMESDRMGHFAGAITQERLDEQREVVKNEKRQNYLNRPYGRVWMLVTELAYPVGHPYSWTTIGRMADLDAATLDDVKEWFGKYYGAANATIVLSGDITPEEAKAKVEKYFGHIPPGPQVDRPGPRVAPMDSHSRYTYADKVSEARIHRVYNVPQWGTDELEHLRLAAYVMGWGKTSRLYKRLVHDEQLATSVSAYTSDGEIGSQLWITASVKAGVDPNRVEAIIDEELAWFMEDGPTYEELTRARVKLLSYFIGRLERVGGFGGTSDLLAQAEVYGGEPDSYQRSLAVYKSATPEEVRNTSLLWLTPGSLTLTVVPEEKFSAAPPAVDRSALPTIGAPGEFDLPEIQRKTLSNGVEVLLMQREDSPMVNVQLLFKGGYTADQLAKPGTMNLTTSLMDEATETRDAMAIAGELEDLGASLSLSSSLDSTGVTLRSLGTTLEPALDVAMDVVMNPTFPEADLERERQLTLSSIQREKTQPATMGRRLIGPLLFGDSHAYGLPLTGSGYESTVREIKREELVQMHESVFTPKNVKILVTGGISLDEISAILESKMQGWTAKDVALQEPGPAPERQKSEFVIIDKPGAAQSMIIAAHPIPEAKALNVPLADLVNDVIGGSFTARINMNLREDKGWSYGARSFVLSTLGPQVFGVSTGVQTDKTAESIVEIDRELREYLTTRPPTADELEKAKASRTLKLPGRNETTSGLLSSLNEIALFGYSDDYFETYAKDVNASSVDDLIKLAPTLIQPDKLLWVVVGDRATIEAKIKELGLGEVKVMELPE